MPSLSATKLVLRCTVVLALLAALVGPGATPAVASNLSGHEQSLACHVADYRLVNGMQPHRVAADLNRVARDHAQVMAGRNHLHHNPSLGSDVQNWTVVAENVGVGPSIASVHRALIASTGHRRNLLDARTPEIGIGVATAGSRIWVVQVFRRPSGSGSGSPADCSGSVGSISVPARGVPIVGDWNGNGQRSPGRFIDGTWYLSNGLSAGGDQTFRFGQPGDIPVVGDWNGNGRDGIGVVRNGRWLLRQAPGGGSPQISFTYGGGRDVPLVGDWNGSGRDGIGIVRNGRWHLRQTASGGNGDSVFTFGRVTQGDVPLVGDWNGNGRDGVGIVRDGRWHLRQTPSGGTGQIVFTYGRVTQGDVPLVGDWNGNGRDGIGIVRDGIWHLRQSPSGGSAQMSFPF